MTSGFFALQPPKQADLAPRSEKLLTVFDFRKPVTDNVRNSNGGPKMPRSPSQPDNPKPSGKNLFRELMNRTARSNHGSRREMKEALEKELRDWWERESKDWDKAVLESDDNDLTGGSDLWADMPALDSKAVARSSHLFKKHTGLPLDIDLIRPGGYESVDEMIKDLVPKMMDRAAKKDGLNS